MNRNQIIGIVTIGIVLLVYPWYVASIFSSAMSTDTMMEKQSKAYANGLVRKNIADLTAEIEKAKEEGNHAYIIKLVNLRSEQFATVRHIKYPDPDIRELLK